MTRLDKVTLTALIIRVTYFVFAVATGSQLPGATLVRVFFGVTVILFLVLSFPRPMRSFVWRVRHRLLVTWIFENESIRSAADTLAWYRAQWLSANFRTGQSFRERDFRSSTL